jgi:sterol desaturase/sphingolipid hydroxylase (fatty acid hydroxylase superfamily)
MDQVIAIFASKGGIILSVLAAFLLLERLFPVARWVGGLWRVVKNLGLAGFNAVLSPLIVLPLTQLAAAHAFHWRPENWTGGWYILIDLLILDCWIYWWHRTNHALPMLWRFHEVHHLDETLDASSALRFHFGEVMLSSVVRAAVVVLLDIPFTSVALFEVLVAVSAIFQHSNLSLPRGLERALSRVIVTPAIHWVHHHAIRRDTDSNYSAILSLWDRIFGSMSKTQRTPGMAIGVEGLRDKPGLRLVVRPFSPRPR